MHVVPLSVLEFSVAMDHGSQLLPGRRPFHSIFPYKNVSSYVRWLHSRIDNYTSKTIQSRIVEVASITYALIHFHAYQSSNHTRKPSRFVLRQYMPPYVVV